MMVYTDGIMHKVHRQTPDQKLDIRMQISISPQQRQQVLEIKPAEMSFSQAVREALALWSEQQSKQEKKLEEILNKVTKSSKKSLQLSNSQLKSWGRDLREDNPNRE